MNRKRGDSVVDELDMELAATIPQLQTLEHIEEEQEPNSPRLSAFDDTNQRRDAQVLRKHLKSHEGGQISGASSVSDHQPGSTPPPPDPEGTSDSTAFAFPSADEILNRPQMNSTTIQDVFIQQPRSFRRARREQFEQMIASKSEKTIGGTRAKRADAAHSFQSSFHNVSLIMQGFLSGLTTAHAVFAFNFAEERLLLEGYRWMALPVHATFYICFVLGTVSALDRIQYKRPDLDGIRNSSEFQSGALNLIIWTSGTLATVLTIHFDETVSPTTVNPSISLTSSVLLWWRILSATRAFCALMAWLLLAMQPNSNHLRDLIAKFQLPEEERELDL